MKKIENLKNLTLSSNYKFTLKLNYLYKTLIEECFYFKKLNIISTFSDIHMVCFSNNNNNNKL